MKRTILAICMLIVFPCLQAQTPCTLSLDSIQLDMQLSTCNNLVFKYKYSGGTPAAYKWTYGDGNACNCIKPKHFYTRNGSWQVCGRIEDANGCADSLCVSFIVNCADPCDLSGIAIYSADTLSYSCNEIEFNAITSSNTRKLRWDFGDGDSSSDKFTVHRYKRNGTYTARLIVQDSIACADTADFEIAIACSDTGTACDFYLNKLDTLFSSDCRTVDFSYGFNHSSVYSKMYFGDGSSAEDDMDISHTYADTGVYQVCITGKDSLECKDSTCFKIRVGCGPVKGLLQPDIQVSQYPNPFGASLTIHVKQESSLQITDMHGRVLFRSVLYPGKNLLKPEIQAAGQYLLRIQSAGGNHVRLLLRE